MNFARITRYGNIAANHKCALQLPTVMKQEDKICTVPRLGCEFAGQYTGTGMKKEDIEKASKRSGDKSGDYKPTKGAQALALNTLWSGPRSFDGRSAGSRDAEPTADVLSRTLSKDLQRLLILVIIKSKYQSSHYLVTHW
ncbi:hypothetical protein B0H14DRAFT_2624850 [Mycena olivaceomarginata]|nr:hypothetical protein B0H14DRAFT_2624850 [Mycena olivaceomarginata]